MTDAVNFSDLVREAFIEPLRSVLIVDDQYPTWEEILNNSLDRELKESGVAQTSTKKDWMTAPHGPLDVINQFRKRNPGFIIDIHDAITKDDPEKTKLLENPIELANHLYQSDLLVLDYNLEGNNSGLRGEKARKIIQSVLLNKHFNLIVVHTGEDDLDEVFFDSLLSLMQSCTSKFDKKLQSKLEQLDTKLDELELDECFDRKDLPKYFDAATYIAIRSPNYPLEKVTRDYMKSIGVLHTLSDWGKSLGLIGEELKNFLFWSIREFEKRKLQLFSKQSFDGLKWHNGSSCKWLRTVRGFVTFVSKGTEDLLGKLQMALENWQPTPSRLLSAKYRHQLSSIGVEAEDRTLLKSHVYAHLYKEIRGVDLGDESKEISNKMRAIKLKEHVLRQSESISSHIEDEIVRFGDKIVSVDVDGACNFSSHYGVDLSIPKEAKLAIIHYNSYISTLPLKNEIEQLDSGHIFELNSEWWVCATPACDLQPRQNSIAFVGDSQNFKPFTALLLKKVDIDDLTSDHITSGAYCFVENKPGEIISLGLRTPVKNEKPVNEKVTWRMFLAADNGVIIKNVLNVLVPKLDANGLVTTPAKGLVTAKLRYEYALNYINKVGGSVSRIGLGYASFGKGD